LRQSSVFVEAFVLGETGRAGEAAKNTDSDF